MARKDSGKRASGSFWAGLIAGPAAVVIGLAMVAPVLPDSAILQAVGRTLDSLAPQMLALGLAMAGAVALLGARRFALALALVALAGIGQLAWQHHQRSLPLAAEGPADLRVLWFNVLGDNPLPAAQIAEGIIETQADVVLLGESGKMSSALPRLFAVYPYHLGCQEQCQVLVLSKRPLQATRLRGLSVVSPERFAQVRIETASGPVTIVAAHLLKPWFNKLAVWEPERLRRRLAEIDGPLVLVGDMNAAPWSRRLRLLSDATGLRFVPVPPSTWPVAAGPFGVPIDNVLVGQGARLRSLTAWGADMGSNHLGLLAEIRLDQPSGS